MQTALLDLDEMGEQAREHHATLATERLQTVEQLRVGEIGERHARVLHREFSRPWAPRGRSLARENASAHLALANGGGAATSARGWLLAETFARKRGPGPRISSSKIDGPDLPSVRAAARRSAIEALWSCSLAGQASVAPGFRRVPKANHSDALHASNPRWRPSSIGSEPQRRDPGRSDALAA